MAFKSTVCFFKQARKKFPVWGWIIVFFAVVFIANAVLVYVASSTFNGVSETDAYEKGLHYNTALSEKEAQQALGWQATLSFTPSSENPLQGVLTIDLRRADNTYLTGAEMKVRLVRPTTEGYDQTLEFAKQNVSTFSAPVTFPLKGQWDVYLDVRQGRHSFKAQKRLVI